MTNRESASQNITWSSYNYPTSISAGDATGSEAVQLYYGADRQRWAQIYTGPTGTEKTYYIGGLLELVFTGPASYRHYIYAGSQPVAIYSRTSTGVNSMSYPLVDYQGSILSNTGTTDVNEAYSVYGGRQNPVTWSGAPSAADLNTIAGLSRQGFTFQTWLGQSMGLNHMNGRVQDAVIGRFLSPDPHITDPTNAQSYNRYSYVNNDPQTYTDPTGFDEPPTPRPIDPCDVPVGCANLVPPPDLVASSDLVPPPDEEGCGIGQFGPCYATPSLDYLLPNPLLSVTNTGPSSTGGGGSAQGPTHNYTVKTLTSCSAADSFASVKSPNGSAPGAPAAQEGFTPQINLWGIESPNPISQNVNSSTMTITNVTLPTHVFYPGSVTINVNSLGPSSSTNTYTGTGNSSSPILNDIVGYLYFGLMNALTTIGCAAQSGMGGAPGP